MHDIVIRGGTIIDGTGAAGYCGDLAVDGGIISSVGGKAGPARRDIDATGRLVTPGWVDIHTHYDGQATWDPILAPTSWHGVTSIMFGNCGVGFAPVRREHRDALIELMEGVEDIPGIALAEGLKWDWESFPDYLDALERLPRTIDVGAMVPHHPLRVFVMGDRAIRREKATVEDIDSMARLVEEAVRAGAFGFTTSRSDQHKTRAGEMVPARHAEVREMLGIGRALGRVGWGSYGVLSDFEFEDEEFEWMTSLANDTRRPVWFLLTDRMKDPARWSRVMHRVKRLREQGTPLMAQVGGRPIGVLLGVAASLNPSAMRKTYLELQDLPLAQKFERLRDPGIRAQILSEQPLMEQVRKLPPLWQIIVSNWDGIYLMGEEPDYEPPPEQSVGAIARRLGITPDEVAYDHIIGGAGRLMFFPVASRRAVSPSCSLRNTAPGQSGGGLLLQNGAVDASRNPRRIEG